MTNKLKNKTENLLLTLCSKKLIIYRTRVNIQFNQILARISEFCNTLWRLGTPAIIISVKRLFLAVFQSVEITDTLLYKSNSLLLKFADKRVFNFHPISRLPAHNLLSTFRLTQTLGRAFAANSFLTYLPLSKEKSSDRTPNLSVKQSVKAFFKIALTLGHKVIPYNLSIACH